MKVTKDPLDWVWLGKQVVGYWEPLLVGSGTSANLDPDADYTLLYTSTYGLVL